MPFKSEKQRKYLWANEPEIARDWTDTYGSGIQAAQGGRIGFFEGAQAETREGKAMSPGTSADYSPGQGHREARETRGAPPGITTSPTHVPTQPTDNRGERINTWLNKKMPNLRHRYNFNKRGDWISKNRDKLIEAGLIEEQEGGPGAWNWTGPGDLTSMAGLKELQNLGYTGGLSASDPRSPHYTGSGGGGQPSSYTGIASQPATTDTTTASTGLGGGHFQVPLDLVLNQQRAAEGGIIGSVGGTSRQKYQEGNIVGEGIDFEGAMMQSQEVIKELYDALIAQGLSPQEAMEELKRMFEGIQAQGPEEGAEEWPRSDVEPAPPTPLPEFGGRPQTPREQGPGGRAAPWQQGPGGRAPPLTLGPEAPMMGEEFPGQEFRGRPRAPAAFGGIMDTYTGRRKYGLGSFLSKAKKKLKKLAGSKLGKIALMYAAGTYLGGMEGMGGGGYGNWFGKGALGPQGAWKKFGTQLLNPMSESGIANLARPEKWSMFQKAPLVDAISGGTDFSKKVLADKVPWYKNPWVTIPAASVAAGLYTAKMPLDDLDDSTDEWDKEKAKWDARYAGMEGAFRLPEDLRLPSAQGGRIGRQEGGLMNLGGMEKDYRNDGGFVPLGGEEKADDVPARLSKNEFVFTADAVRNAGGGDIDRGAEVMENVMKNLEGGGQISEESQGQGAQEMFETSERLSEVI